MRDFSAWGITTTFGESAESARASVCAEQPVTSSGARGFLRVSARSSDLALWSAREVTVHVLTTCTSAGSLPETTAKPAVRNAEARDSVSYWLSLHPKV